MRRFLKPIETLLNGIPMEILVVKPSSLGDIIQALRVAQSIRDQMPDAVISWVVRDRFADVVRRCPTVNGRIIEFHRTNWLRTAPGLFRDIRQSHFDVVLDFQGLLRSGLMTMAARSPRKIGHLQAREGSHFFYTERVPLPADGDDAHHVAIMLQFLPAIGLRAELTTPITLQCEPPYHVDSRLKGSNPIVLLPNSREPSREWPHFAALAERIIKTDRQAVVVWDSHIEFKTPTTLENDRFINLSRRTGLMEMAGLISMAKLVVANDSGGTHVASAFGVPLLALFGPTLPNHSGPYPLDNGRNFTLIAPEKSLPNLSVETVHSKLREISHNLANVRKSA
ncbi:MAG: glycosyltransferase family 9 protein [Planctomycetota bacterium]